MTEAGYPQHWEADVLLRDGRPCHLRPIRADDAPALVDFHSSLSAKTIYYRFFAPYPELSERDVERFTHVDYHDRVALVATQSGEMIGVGRYDRISEGEAEIAFTVRDDHQGRGIGSVLLEHLAAVARENGIERFYAEVLPDNRRMIATFAEAGYRPSQKMSDGVVHMEFDIEPTLANSTVMLAREHAAEARSVEALFYPAKIVVVGVSRREDSLGQLVVRNLKAAGFTGSIYAVHPEVTEVAGLRAYPSVAEAPGPIDLAIITAPITSVPQIVDDCAAAGVRAIEVIATGFSVMDPQGPARRRDLVSRAREAGIRIIGPEAMGIINTDPRTALNASLADIVPGRGRIGFFCESGTLGATVLEEMAGRGLGLTTFVSAGVRADVSVNDLLQYWDSDGSTAVVLLYLQTLGNPRKFARIARRLSRRKPVIAVLAGRADGAWPPIELTHTTRLDAGVVDQLLAQNGILQTHTLAGMLDAAALLALQPVPRGPRVALVSNSAALLLLSADLVAAAGMTVVERPYRVEWNATGEQLAAVLSEALSAGDVHSVLVIHVPPVRAESDEINEVLHDAASTATKPLLAVLPHSTGLTGRSSLVTSPGPHGLPGPGSVPIFGEPAAAIAALALAVQHSAWLREPVGLESTPAGVDPVAAEMIISARVGELLPNEDAMTTTGGPTTGGPNPGGPSPDGVDVETDLEGTQPIPRIHVLGSSAVLDQDATAELLSCYGLELWPHYPVHSEEEAAEIADRLGYPVVLKTLAHRLAHRADLGGVRLSLENERSLRTAYLSIAAQHPQDVREALVVQRMAPAGVACRVITREDPAFGPVMGFSIGGFMSDLIDDWTWWMPPLTGVEAAALVRAPKTAPLLFGYHGADHADVDALADVLHRIAALAGNFPQIAQLEINPILATTTGCYLLGAQVELATAVERQEVRPRRL